VKRFLPSIGSSFLLLLALGFVSCSSSLPPIGEPAKLVTDCTALAVANPQGDISSSQWPASVAALHPISVQHEGDSIFILTFQKTGQGARGYAVGKAEPLVGHYAFTQDSPGIYRFEFTP
jgi:hypothetical protein